MNLDTRVYALPPGHTHSVYRREFSATFHTFTERPWDVL